MKRNDLRPNRRSKGKMRASTQDNSGFIPRLLQPSGGAPGGRNSALHLGWSGTHNKPHVVAEEEKSLGEAADHKDVKNEGRSGNVYENKGSNDTMTDNYSGFCAWSAPFLQK